MIERALMDNSAWVRLEHPGLSADRRLEIADAIEAGQVFACLPFALEVGYSARNGPNHVKLLRALRDLPWAGIDDGVERRAVEAQGQLARNGHHRLPPADLLIAAIADRHQLRVLHYDSDYDVIAGKTDLRISSTWLAKRGSL